MGKFSLAPGVRYIKQFDDGAGKVGGAAYSGSLAGKRPRESDQPIGSSLTVERLSGRKERGLPPKATSSAA